MKCAKMLPAYDLIIMLTEKASSSSYALKLIVKNFLIVLIYLLQASHAPAFMLLSFLAPRA
jgi:hypothetical protein